MLELIVMACIVVLPILLCKYFCSMWKTHKLEKELYEIAKEGNEINEMIRKMLEDEMEKSE